MKQVEIAQLMADSAQDAIKFANDEFQVKLDETIESIAIIDELILNCLPLLNNESEKDKIIFTVCNMFGAYLGEVFIKYIGGQWIYDDSNPDAPSTYLSFNGKTFAFAGICYQRLINDQTVSVRKYFELAQGKVTQ
ncbi:hypothetical protein C2869_12660 [Saccharobesus litoralis]|uniref:DUF3806 domain-containing protein n=1 Tax=Saccharobesus litoralis TaxID=2172099 RepID=A0A2S0VSR1_9ALTE|nr:hypothetical protein [Saccharobesus litoralis]AWB67237.1 hypothetical protein C2869_12660 [Saccharobesus litoralis]